jgi:hypothetical protein
MRRLILSATTLALSLCASSTASAVEPKTVYVRKDGQDLCNGAKNVPFNLTLQCAKRTIQGGVNAVAGRGTVKVAAGKYTENVTIGKSLYLVGAGKGQTVVLPAVSAPKPCEDSSLCGGAASSVLLVKASDVWIQALTVDGANPLKTGVMVEGMDIDARNGIIEDHLSGVYKRLTVKDVEVKNVYLRGINAASGGTGFLLSGNTVTNVRGGPGSVAIFASDASGTITLNHVSLANDGIGVNHSYGVKITGNVVEQTGSGIHIDNTKPPGPGILLDLIESNTVSDCTAGGFGVWLLATKGNVVVNDNTVSSCDVGLGLLGGGGTSDVTFSGNTVTGEGAANTAGIYVTTDTFAWGHFDTEALFTANVVSGVEAGAFVEQGGGMIAIADFEGDKLQGSLAAIENKATVSATGACLAGSGKGLINHPGGSATVHSSAIAGNDLAGVENLDAAMVDAADNWWGSADGPAPGGSGDAAVGPVDFSPFLASSPVACN